MKCSRKLCKIVLKTDQICVVLKDFQHGCIHNAYIQWSRCAWNFKPKLLVYSMKNIWWWWDDKKYFFWSTPPLLPLLPPDNGHWFSSTFMHDFSTSAFSHACLHNKSPVRSFTLADIFDDCVDHFCLYRLEFPVSMGIMPFKPNAMSRAKGVWYETRMHSSWMRTDCCSGHY